MTVPIENQDIENIEVANTTELSAEDISQEDIEISSEYTKESTRNYTVEDKEEFETC